MPLIQNLGIEIQRAKNMHKARSVMYFFIAIANAFVSIPLIKVFGPVGAAFGTAISLWVGNILFMNWYYQNRIGLNIWLFWRNILSFVPALIVPIIVGVLINLFIPIKCMTVLFAMMIVYAVVFCISMYLLGMNNEEKQMIIGPFNKLLKRK